MSLNACITLTRTYYKQKKHWNTAAFMKVVLRLPLVVCQIKFSHKIYAVFCHHKLISSRLFVQFSPMPVCINQTYHKC